MEAFSASKEDVVLRRKVAVELPGWPDALGDLSNRNVVVTLVDEQLARRVENRSADGLLSRSWRSLMPMSLAAFLNVNSVRSSTLLDVENVFRFHSANALESKT
jgi:hypothetical protein